MFGCVNDSPINVKTERDWYGNAIMGGVFGYSYLGSQVIACYNTADLTIREGTLMYNVGGVAGGVYGIQLLGCYSSGDIIDNAITAKSSEKGALVGEYSSDPSSSVMQCWYVGSSDLGTDGIGAGDSVVDCGRVSDIALLNGKINGMNTAIKTYNDTTTVGKKCLFSFIDGGSGLPTLQAGAPN